MPKPARARKWFAAGPIPPAGWCLCSLVATIGICGCTNLPGPFSTSQPATVGQVDTTGPAEATDLFAPPVPPNGWDPERARAALGDIPGYPPAPPVATHLEPELPRQAMRRMEEARRLFIQERFSEAASECEKALRYNSNIAEAHRLAALACLFSGKNAQARTHAESALEVKPDDLACHYVRGRLAEKAEQLEAALLSYRTAVKCPAGKDDQVYLALSRHQLGLLLYGLGYYRAAVDQLSRFESAVTDLTASRPENPELATILNTKRLAPLLALAGAHEALREFGPAADRLSAAIHHDPENSAIRFRFIKDLVRAERFDEAISAADRQAAKDKDVQSATMLMAVHRKAGVPERGLEAVYAVVQAAPDNVDLALYYADALISARRFGDAVTFLNDLLAGHPDASAARWKLVSVHRGQGHWREWMWSMAAQLAANPEDVARGMTELAQMQVDHAAQAIDEALGRRLVPASQPPTTDRPRVFAAYHYCLGWLADRLDRPEDAQALYEKALRADPGFVPATIGLAEMWIGQCEWDRAIAVLNEAHPDDPPWQAIVERSLGRCYDGLDDFTEAMKHYEASVERNLEDETLLDMGRLLERYSRPKDAALLYEQILKLNPRSVEAREQLITNLLNRWSEGDALKRLLGELKQMQDKAPEDPATIRTTALVRLLMHQPQDLAAYVRVLTTLVEARPDDHKSRRALAVALYRMGDYEAGRRELTRLLEKLPRDPEANELLALALMQELDIAAAAEHLARVLEWYPHRETLLRDLAEVRLVQQDYASALSIWQQLLSMQSNAGRHLLYRNRLARTCLQAGWHDKLRQLAAEWVDEVDQEEIPAIRSYLLAADAAEANYDQYLRRCRDWLAEKPKDEQIRQWLLGIGPLPGQATGGLIGAGRLDEAVVQATAWAAESPKEPFAQQTLIQTLRAARRPGDMIEICRANLSLADKPDQRIAGWHLLAEAYVLGKRYEEAIGAVKELTAEAARMTRADVSFELDELLTGFLVQAKRYSDAAAHANKLILDLDTRETRLQDVAAAGGDDAAHRLYVLKEQERIREHRARVLRSLSFIYIRQDRRDLTIECLKKALEYAPKDAGINNDLGYTMADAGVDLDAAERMLKAAVSEVLWTGVGQDDRQAAFMDSLGWLYYKRGRFEKARQWLALSAKMEDGSDPVIHDHLGDVQWRLGHAAEAVRSWTRALELHEKKVAAQERDPDEEFVDSVKAKLAEVENGGKPAVATSTAD